MSIGGPPVVTIEPAARGRCGSNGGVGILVGCECESCAEASRSHLRRWANCVAARVAISTVLIVTIDVSVIRALGQSTLQDEVEQLKRQVASQQEQINQLRRMLDAQAKLPAEPVPSQPPIRAAEKPAPRPPEPGSAPRSLHFGRISLTPTGFLDFSQVWRSKTVTSGLPTNFAAIPFNDTVEGNRRQTLSTAANSRLGMQLNAALSGIRLLGVVETDFLGYQPGNVATTTNSYGLRLRLAFADLRAGKWEFLAGQNWSLLTPGRKDISALPGGLMLTQDLDPNIQSGLIWTRSPQARMVYRPKDGVALGVSFESGEPYAGGSAGAGTITLPSAFAPNYFNQLGIGTSGLGVPNPNLDLIAKIAFDPKTWGRNVHIEFAGLINRVAFFNPLASQRFDAIGGGVSFNASTEITKNLTAFTSNFFSDGGGRFIYGEAPDLIVDGNGAPSLLHSMSTMDGIEYQARPKLRLWMYYGGTYIGRNVAIDPLTGYAVGYGYTGAPNSQNRSIQEVTGGFTRMLWHDSNLGAIQFSGQYSWLVRHPWYVSPGKPGSANLNMLYLGFRYILPAAAAEDRTN